MHIVGLIVVLWFAWFFTGVLVCKIFVLKHHDASPCFMIYGMVCVFVWGVLAAFRVFGN
jgi:hypothetical protein